MKSLSATTAITVLLLAPVAGAVDMPPVPAQVIAQALLPPQAGKPGAPAAASPAANGTQAAPDLPGIAELTVKPGVNEIVEVAISHLNRIVTPFPQPEVRTTTSATTDVHGNVIYVSTADPGPVTMYITKKGREDVAISLTLAPMKIPPREIRLKLPDGAMPELDSHEEAAQWETSQPYVEAIQNGFKAVALGKVPQGYSLRQMMTADRRPECNTPPGIQIDYSSAQILTGANIDIVVAKMRNRANQPAELLETWCAATRVAAVAFWPRNALDPGEETEVYIARRRGEVESEMSARPSLLNGARR